MPFGNLTTGGAGNGAGGYTTGDAAGGNGAGGSTSGDTVGKHAGAAGGSGPRGNKNTPPLTPKQQSAKQNLTDWLNTLGLGALGTQVWNEYLQGTPTAKIMADVRASDAYAQRFPGMKELAAGGHAITEADYIAKESADISLMRAYGLPDQMINNRQELGKLIGGQVSTAELQTRLDAYKQVVLTLPHEVRDYLGGQGVSSGDLIGFWLNPDEALPMLQNKVAAAEVGGAAAFTGYGKLDPKMAAQLAGQGVDWQHALAGFTQAAQLKGLTQQLPGQQGALASADLVNATVGANGDANNRLLKVQAQRKNQFADQQSYATTQAGAVGLGVSDQP
jgi:hypothetical protein